MKLALFASSSLLVIAATPANAQLSQTAAPPATESTPEQAATDEPAPADIVVTGSLIRGSAENAAAPVDVISSRELASQGSPSTLDLVKNLSSASGIVGEANQTDARSGSSEGAATINLRGLGPARTLVLLNGRRLVNAGIALPAVDINLIPSAAIDRVEVLKDGAAATYGSDAIGGVVNFITREQEGFLVSGSYRYVRGSDGDWDGGISYGHSGDGFRMFASFGYQHRSTLESIDRDFTIQPYASNPQGGYTGSGSPGNFDFNGTTGGTSYRADLGCTSLGGFRTLPGSTADRCITQYGLYTNLVNQEDRYQAFLDTEIDLSSSAKLRLGALYGWSQAVYATSPSLLSTQAPSANAVGGGTNAYVIPSYAPALRDYCNYFGAATAGCSVDASGAPIAPATSLPVLSRPFLVGGNPLFADDNDRGASRAPRDSEALRFTADLTVDLTDNIAFDFGGTYSSYSRKVVNNDTFVDLLQNAYAGFGGPNCPYATTASRAGLSQAQIAALAGRDGCTFFNPFSTATERNSVTDQVNPGYAGTRSPAGFDLTPGAGLINDNATIRNFYRPSHYTTVTELYVVDATISGKSGIHLPGGEIGFAVGGQFRRNTYSLSNSDNNNLAIYPCVGTVLNPNATCSAQVGAMGFIGSDVNREAAGNAYAAYVEVQAPIIDAINLQLALRYEDYGSPVGSTLDPQARVKVQLAPWLALRGGVGTTFRSPAPQSLAGVFTTLQSIGGSFRAVDVRGAPLKPESATTYNAGIILDAGPFSGSIDYWRYDFSGPIESEPVQGIVAALFGANGSANCDNPAYAELQSRFTFTAAGCGIANVQRLTTFAINTANVRTSGIDAQGQFRFPIGDTRLSFGGSGSYTLEYKIADQQIGGIVVQPAFDAAGKLNFQTTAYPLPRLKGQLFAQVEHGVHNLRAQFNYVDGYTDQRGAAIFGPNTAVLGGASVTAGKRIPAFPTVDVTYRLVLGTGTILALTGTNIFDRDPPFARLDQNYDPFTASPLGATVKLGVSQSF